MMHAVGRRDSNEAFVCYYYVLTPFLTPHLDSVYSLLSLFDLSFLLLASPSSSCLLLCLHVGRSSFFCARGTTRLETEFDFIESYQLLHFARYSKFEVRSFRRLFRPSLCFNLRPKNPSYLSRIASSHIHHNNNDGRRSTHPKAAEIY
jgi:hypothetical protein